MENFKRSLRGSKRAVGNMNVTAQGVGYGLLLFGAIVAIVSLLAVLFVSSATFTFLDAEEGAAVGIALAVSGAAVHAMA